MQCAKNGPLMWCGGGPHDKVGARQVSRSYICQRMFETGLQVRGVKIGWIWVAVASTLIQVFCYCAFTLHRYIMLLCIYVTFTSGLCKFQAHFKGSRILSQVRLKSLSLSVVLHGYIAGFVGNSSSCSSACMTNTCLSWHKHKRRMCR